MKDYGMVIVGAGEAGTRAALELRTQGWNGAITIIGGEDRIPYERPPLSKQHLYSEEEPMPVVIAENEMFNRHQIRLISGVTGVQIDRPRHVVVLSDRSEVRYERLLLATGANPRKLSVNGNALNNIMYLRTFADAQSIRKRLQPGKRIAVIGGGFIGLEVTASAIMKGCQVTLIEVAPRILMRGVPEEIARIVEERHCKAGVQLQIGRMIESIDWNGDEYVIVLVDRTRIHADAVIAGVGAIPETSLAAGCSLELDNGISVDEMLMTVDPDIFAAGDCCSFPHALYGGRRIRLEAWRNAQDQGMHAARNMMSTPVPYTALPWFWSDQYEQTLQVAGLPDNGKTMVLRDLGDAGKIFFHVSEEERLVSVSAIGPSESIAREVRLSELLIQRQAIVLPEILSDPRQKLKVLLRPE